MLRRTIHIEGGEKTLNFSPALVVGDNDYIFVRVCWISEPKENVLEGSNEIIWWNADGTELGRKKVQEAFYTEDLLAMVASKISGIDLYFDSFGFSYVREGHSGKTMTMPKMDKLLEFPEGKVFSPGNYVKSDRENSLYTTKWINVKCDAVDSSRNSPDGTIAEFPYIPVDGYNRFEVSSMTKLARGTYQSITFTTVDHNMSKVDGGTITLEFYIIPGDSPRTPFPIPTPV